MINEKKAIISTISDLCKKMGLNYTTNVKSSMWRADVVVKHESYKVAFNVCKMPRNAEYTYTAMKNEGVLGCWLLLPSKNSSNIRPNLPCFSVQTQTDKVYVYLNTRDDFDLVNIFELPVFIHYFINGKIKFVERAEIDKVELCIYKRRCWKCQSEFDLYCVSRLFSKDGAVISRQYLEDYVCSDEFIELNPIVIRAFKNYMQDHPGIFDMGAIKSRYSRTCDQTYTSFGCPRCDSIYGKWFFSDDIQAQRHGEDLMCTLVVSLDEVITVSVSCWSTVS